MAIVTKGSGGRIIFGGVRIISSGGGGGGSFDPTSISGLVAWYKADSLSLSNLATVTTWNDSSGAGNHLSSYSGTPQYLASDAVLGNNPGVYYDANSANYTSSASSMPAGSSASTTYIVGYYINASSGLRYMFSWGDWNSGNDLSVQGGTDGIRFSSAVYTSGMATTQRSHSVSTPFLYFLPYAAGSDISSSTTYLNGVSNTGGSSGVPNLGGNNISMGTAAGRGNIPWTVSSLAGVISEVLVYNTAHSVAEYSAVQTYLSAKYGISV